MTYRVSEEEFENMVADAIDSIPERFAAELENIAFFIEDEPPEGESEDLLGLYDGISLDERADGYGLPGDFPDSITVFKGPHERACNTRTELAEEVRVTVVHEVGHYFGMDEDQIDQMGYA